MSQFDSHLDIRPDRPRRTAPFIRETLASNRFVKLKSIRCHQPENTYAFLYHSDIRLQSRQSCASRHRSNSKKCLWPRGLVGIVINRIQRPGKRIWLTALNLGHRSDRRDLAFVEVPPAAVLAWGAGVWVQRSREQPGRQECNRRFSARDGPWFNKSETAILCGKPPTAFPISPPGWTGSRTAFRGIRRRSGWEHVPRPVPSRDRCGTTWRARDPSRR